MNLGMLTVEVSVTLSGRSQKTRVNLKIKIYIINT